MSRRKRQIGPSVTRGEGGFTTLELVVITPFLLAFVLLIVGYGRVTHGRALVEQTAAAAARAATLTGTPSQAVTAATEEASRDLAQAGLSCQSMHSSVDTTQFGPGGQVTVRIRCVTDLSNLTVVGFPGHKTLTASATSPLGEYRQFGVTQ